MAYKKANEVLPEELLIIIQDYIDGGKQKYSGNYREDQKRSDLKVFYEKTFRFFS